MGEHRLEPELLPKAGNGILVRLHSTYSGSYGTDIQQIDIEGVDVIAHDHKRSVLLAVASQMISFRPKGYYFFGFAQDGPI